MIQGLFLIILLVASYFFWRLLELILTYLTTLCAELGAKVHTYAKMPEGEETNAWLLSLLLGITRYPTLILGTAGFFLEVLHYMYSPFEVLLLRNFTVNAFFFLLLLRLLGVVMGSVMYGNSLKNVIGSLES